MRAAALAVVLAAAAPTGAAAASVGAAQAQTDRSPTGSVAGRVTDAETGEPVVGAAVRLRAGGRSVGRATDRDGRFRFDVVAEGRALLRVEALGFAPLDTAVVVASGREVTLDLGLRPETRAVAEVVVQARRSETATRADTPVLLVPQAVTVVSEAVLEAQGARDATDALRNVAGATSTARGQPGAVPVLRGFETDQTGGGVRRNGVELPYLSDGLHANVARVEVLRGPASVLYGRLEPGGVVNFITAKPRRQRHARVEAEGGTLGSGRVLAEAGGPLGHALAARAVGEVERQGSARDDVSTSSAFASPALRWRPSGRLVVDVEAEGVAQNAVIDPGLAALGPPSAATLDAVPRGRFFGEPDARYRWRSAGVFTAVEWQARPAVVLRATGSIQRSRLARDVLDLRRAVDAPAAIGSATNAASGPDVARRLQRESFGFTYAKGSAFADVRVQTGPVAHALTVGAEALRAWAQADGRAPLIDGPGGLVFAEVAPVPLADPRPTGLPGPDDEVGYLDASVGGLDLGAFVQNRATLAVGGGALHVVGSARVSHVRSQAEIVALADSPDAPAGLSVRTASVTAVTPAAGVVAELGRGVALYGSVGTSFNPVVERVDRDGQPFRPTRGVQVEGGAKVETARLAATASAFWIRKDDALTSGAGGFFDQTGQQRSRGVELEARGEPLGGLVVVASYGYLEAEVTEDVNVAPGTPLPYAPRHSGSVWAEWQMGRVPGVLPGGLALRGGVWALGRRPGQLASPVTLPAQAVVDLGAEAGLGRGLSVRLDVRNAFDVRGYTAALTRPGQGADPLVVGWPNRGREVRLGLVVRR